MDSIKTKTSNAAHGVGFSEEDIRRLNALDNPVTNTSETSDSTILSKTDNFYIVNVQETDPKTTLDKNMTRTFLTYKGLANQIKQFVTKLKDEMPITDEELNSELNAGIAFKLFSFFKIFSTKICRSSEEGGTFFNKTDIYHKEGQKYLYKISIADVSNLKPYQLLSIKGFCETFNKLFNKTELKREHIYITELKKISFPIIGIDADNVQELYLYLIDNFCNPVLKNADFLFNSDGIKFEVGLKEPEFLITNIEPEEIVKQPVKKLLFQQSNISNMNNFERDNTNKNIYDILKLESNDPIASLTYKQYTEIRSNFFPQQFQESTTYNNSESEQKVEQVENKRKPREPRSQKKGRELKAGGYSEDTLDSESDIETETETESEESDE
jgi:hypothetical protein